MTEAIKEKKHKRLSSVQFFQLCEHVRALRDWFANTSPSMSEAIEALSKKVGHPVNDKALLLAVKTTEVAWERQTRKSPVTSRKTLLVLAESMIGLSQDLGRLPSLSLLQVRQSLIESLRDHPGTGADA